MYSYEERIKAVELYIQYDFQAELTAAELGYATAKSIQRWYKEFQKQGNLHKKRISLKKYTEAQKEQAIKYYSEHGRSVARTVRALGYPNRDTMFQWLDEAFPNRKKCCISKNALIEFPPEKKEQAVIDLCARVGSAKEVAEAHGISRVTLYKWKKELLNEGCHATMPKKTASKQHKPERHSIQDLQDEKAALEEQVSVLKADIYRLKLERDVLEMATEVLKKDEGINLQTIRNHEKAEVIYAMRDRYRIKELLELFHSGCGRKVGLLPNWLIFRDRRRVKWPFTRTPMDIALN